MNRTERIDSLRRAVSFGLSNGKSNMIADLDLLAQIIAERDGACAAIERCMQTANGRETEWGERAVMAFGHLHEFCMARTGGAS